MVNVDFDSITDLQWKEIERLSKREQYCSGAYGFRCNRCCLHGVSWNGCLLRPLTLDGVEVDSSLPSFQCRGR